MPQTKTIIIDEVLPAPSLKKQPSHGRHQGVHNEKEPPYTTGQSPRASESTDSSFTDSGFGKHWGWKTRTTLRLTQWFLFLKNKPYGKWITGFAAIFAVILIIPLGFCALLAIAIVSVVKTFLSTLNKPHSTVKNVQRF